MGVGIGEVFHTCGQVSFYGVNLFVWYVVTYMWEQKEIVRVLQYGVGVVA